MQNLEYNDINLYGHADIRGKCASAVTFVIWRV